jgi:hypothetical protein
MGRSALALVVLASQLLSCAHLPDTAAEPSGGCFTHHLLEAIDLNETRRPVYAAWTGNESVAISDALIASERAVLLIASWMDARARPYRDAGIALLCEEFAPMSLAPPLQRRPDATPAAQSSGSATAAAMQNGAEIRRELERALDRRGLLAVSLLAERTIARLDSDPDRNCLLRHVLESFHRVAVLAPRQHARALAAGLPSPLPISVDLLRAHLLSLEMAADLDARAAPLQARGIEILCRELPPIDRP